MLFIFEVVEVCLCFVLFVDGMINLRSRGLLISKLVINCFIFVVCWCGLILFKVVWLVKGFV